MAKKKSAALPYDPYGGHPTRGHTGGAPIPKQALPTHDNRFLPRAGAPIMATGGTAGAAGGAMQMANGGWMRYGQSGGIGGPASTHRGLQNMLSSGANVGGVRSAQSGGVGSAGSSLIAQMLGYGGPIQANGAYGAPTGQINNVGSNGVYAGGGGGFGGAGGIGGGYGAGGAGGYGGGGNWDNLVNMLQGYQDQANAANEARYQEGKSIITGGQKKANDAYARRYDELYGLAGQISNAGEQRAKRAGEQELANYTSQLYNMGLANNTGALVGRQGIVDRATERTNAAADEGLRTQMGLKGRYADTMFDQAPRNRNELTSWIFNKEEQGPDMRLWASLLQQPGATGTAGGIGGGGYSPTGAINGRTPRARAGGTFGGSAVQGFNNIGGFLQQGQNQADPNSGLNNAQYGLTDPAQPNYWPFSYSSGTTLTDGGAGGGRQFENPTNPASWIPQNQQEEWDRTYGEDAFGPADTMPSSTQAPVPMGTQQSEGGPQQVLGVGPMQRTKNGFYISPAMDPLLDQRTRDLPVGAIVICANGAKYQKTYGGGWGFLGS